MACGGISFLGATGEDYATPGFDAISLQTSSPSELVGQLLYLRGAPDSGAIHVGQSDTRAYRSDAVVTEACVRIGQRLTEKEHDHATSAFFPRLTGRAEGSHSGV